MLLYLLSPWIAVETTPDPISLATQLGVAAITVGLALAWQRDTAKQRDRAIATNESIAPVLVEIRDALRSNAQAFHESADATTKATAALARGISEAEATRLRDALDRAEHRQRST